MFCIKTLKFLKTSNNELSINFQLKMNSFCNFMISIYELHFCTIHLFNITKILLFGSILNF